MRRLIPVVLAILVFGVFVEGQGRIASFSKIGLGTGSPSVQIHAYVAGTTPGITASGTQLVLQNNANTGDSTGITMLSGATGTDSIRFGDSANQAQDVLTYTRNTQVLSFTSALSIGTTLTQVAGGNGVWATFARGGGSGAVIKLGNDAAGREVITTSGPLFVLGGSGTPEASVTAPVGSLYMRTNGGAGTTLYVKETGSGNTGWVGK